MIRSWGNSATRRLFEAGKSRFRGLDAESALELFRAGAAPNNISIVRPRVAEGQPPEVFPIHLRAILSKKNEQSNVRLQPYDQVYIGETWQSSLAKCIPPCLRPLYDTLCGLRHPTGAAKQTGTTTASNQLPDSEVHAPEN